MNTNGRRPRGNNAAWRRTKRLWIVPSIVVLADAGRVNAGLPANTAFLYQGQLKQDGAPVGDVCAFEFRLFDALTEGTQVGPTLTFDGVDPNPPPIEVVNGLFQAALDFGADAFPGDPRFLQVGIRCPAAGTTGTTSSGGGFVDLAPRQVVLAAPYAIRALNAEMFALPFAATVDLQEDVFSITNTGEGEAAVFAMIDPALPLAAAPQVAAGEGDASFAAVRIFSHPPATAVADALSVTAAGKHGNAADLESTDNTNPNSALSVTSRSPQASTAGFIKLNPNGDPFNFAFGNAATVFAINDGQGSAGAFSINNDEDFFNTNDSAALRTRTRGFGPAGLFEIDRAFTGFQTDPENSGAPAVHAKTNAGGPAALFEQTATGTTAQPALKVTSSTRDTVARIIASDPNNANPTLHVSQEGVGPAARIEGLFAEMQAVNTVEIVAKNSRHGLFVEQSAQGEAAHFEIADPGNANNAVFIQNNGPGTALSVANSNTGLAALALGVRGKSAFNGPVDILGPMGGPVPVTITGETTITGNLTVAGGEICGPICAPTKLFRIDHPLDPQSKYLQHASVESSEMKNLYDGTVVLDEHGTATVSFADWFEALNENFRYQLTPIGAPAPNLHVANEIHDGRFSIAGGSPGMKVSWQVTGVRKDAYARAHPLQVEMPKSDVAHDIASERHQLNGNQWINLFWRLLEATVQSVQRAWVHDAFTSAADREWDRSADANGPNDADALDSFILSD